MLVPADNRRVVLRGVSWDLYQRLVHEVEGNGHRLTFDQGRLEIMSPSARHENVKTVIARLVEAYGDAMKINVEGLGSTTFAREDLQKGLEPDECYYVANAQAVVGKEELDLTIDPPPDLAIEVDISPPNVKRQPIYAALAVPEIWRYDGTRVIPLHRDRAGGYSPANQSLAFPKLSMEMLNELVTIGLSQGQSAAVAELRRRLSASPT
jgi:Uma2 family endonuclease